MAAMVMQKIKARTNRYGGYKKVVHMTDNLGYATGEKDFQKY